MTNVDINSDTKYTINNDTQRAQSAQVSTAARR